MRMQDVLRSTYEEMTSYEYECEINQKTEIFEKTYGEVE